MGSKKKIRGLKRRIRQFTEELNELTRDFPEDLSNGYWELHLPNLGSEWISSTKTPFNVRKKCLQFLINRTKHLIEKKPAHYKDTRVMLMIDSHYWWSTKIEIFSAKNDEGLSFYREDDYTRWIALDENRNLSKEWGLTIPDGLEVKGIKEEIKDLELVDDDIFGGEIWFIGELN
ncbi:hypothetical protein AWH48_20335 [Domibacillus aminovorans]|uniref:DUF3916 domain-containing protein n=1 Tax=Domibacillus aminovorans TaxID=29332 RepID=A0A177KPF9_9BACI|nr:DUF3916 domain-containing protein [Domibacillus aminovorans]OAH55027.1 hypothetical protein AWH48_20335 [Domibacillus aminovorans]